MGDFNIDLKRKESGCKARMQQDTTSKLLSKGWWQLMTEKTFKSKSRTLQSKDGGSTIDWILVNKPKNIVQTKAEWTGSGADHAIVWAIKEMREEFRKKQMTRKPDGVYLCSYCQYHISIRKCLDCDANLSNKSSCKLL